MTNPLLKMARFHALNQIINKPHDDIYGINELAKLKAKERQQIEVPLTTQKGLKESLTKRLKPKI